MNNYLNTSVSFIKGVGPQKAALLQKELGIATYEDLLMHFPYRYIDAQSVSNISELNPQMEFTQMRGIIMNLREEGVGFKKRLVAELVDKSGAMELVWFQGVSWVKKNIQPNKVYTVSGRLSFFNGRATISHPELELYDPNKLLSNTLIPLYSTTEKLKSVGITNRTFGKLVAVVLANINEQHFVEYFPFYLLQQYNLLSRYDTIKYIHQPINLDFANRAIRRTKWEELFFMQLKIGQLKVSNQSQPGYRFDIVGQYFNSMYSQYMPFDLTNAQKRVLKEIRADVKSGKQMNRLVQGDVGSGKTMVAFMSMLMAKDNGFQACMMAPTEILAQQHYESISKLASKLGINVQLLTGSIKAKEKKQILHCLKEGVIDIIIGTHALIEDTVVFKNLGLAVIDEQHRFGVGQRAKLWAKNALPPHILVMTATPIPRTLAMTAYGDLEVSIIDELPPGRKPITTIHRSENYRPQVMQLVRAEIQKGRQVYIVYPLIDESDKLTYESLMQGYEQVKMWFPSPQFNIAMVHGKMANDEKEMNMNRFISGDAHIMVATTVIEVGVNVPNASVMIIESAEKFGLSQLHQLRGRVGRGSEKSYCILLTANDISKEARQRMSIMVQTNDGFVIAEEDLRMRGPGDIYGTRQSGLMEFKMADIVKDADIMDETRKAAMQLLSNDPYLMKMEHLPLRGILNKNNSTQSSHNWKVIS